ncbi:cytochrome P450 [Vararia minispora EC-137]|uniref:Cytochrome P450 n=1 Tax=Vararia minispora EC-137 TaxID=1314806 RepID=A0ACB8QBA7_9AGAM|nr:cytochrome P450 [Vararia minispora EC-137]
MSSSYLLVDALAAAAFIALLYGYISRKQTLTLPPGPPRLPVFGNAFDVPKDYAWKQYAKWSEKYGQSSQSRDVISLEVFGQTIIVINSHSALEDIVLVRSATFTGRPYNKFAEMVGWTGSNIPLTTVGREWRERRRVMENCFKPAAMREYRGLQTQKVLKLLRHVLEKPNDIADHTREYTGAFILDVVYGYDVQSVDDHFVKINEELQAVVPYTVLPGALIVNTLPIRVFPFLGIFVWCNDEALVGHLPLWMLGRKFADLTVAGKRSWQKVLYEPYEWVKKGMRNGTAKESLLRTGLLSLADADAEEEQVLVDGLGNAYFAAIDTTTFTLKAFILNMILNPHVQAKAREELDRVIGRERVPDSNDRSNLPYIEAIYMETLRWDPTAPLGVPHTADEDVMCEGFYIPRGAIVIGNAWAILHDPVQYPDPDSFQPERHLSAEDRVVNDPLLDYAFGYGTRKCPGRHFADATLWLYIATVLTFFEIHRAKGEDGREMPVDGRFEPRSLVHGPLPFSCTLVPRDERALEHILQQYQ